MLAKNKSMWRAWGLEVRMPMPNPKEIIEVIRIKKKTLRGICEKTEAGPANMARRRILKTMKKTSIHPPMKISDMPKNIIPKGNLAEELGIS
jgi:hypothetical protein